MSALQQGAVAGLLFGLVLGSLPRWTVVARWRRTAKHFQKLSNHWLDEWAKVEGERDAAVYRLSLPALCPSCTADREILRSGCTPPRAGVES